MSVTTARRPVGSHASWRMPAASAPELFAIVADPRRHRELDGSGTVGHNIHAPPDLIVGSRFATKMRMFGTPYRSTSTISATQARRADRIVGPAAAVAHITE